ncbi:MAG: hypothetical protein ACXAC2_17325, partial [Candidatus Kariarchaeaceae archaeon]
SLGTYNYTIVISDISGNSFSDQVWVTVQDTTAPFIPTPPVDITYEEGTIGHSISWIATDYNPGTYVIYKEGVSVDSGSWSSGIPIIISVNGLTLGVYNYTLIVHDSLTNSISDLVWVTVTDSVSPSLSQPSDITYEHDSSGNTISWSASDSYPDTYIIYREGVPIDSDSWVVGTPISISIDGLAIGLHNYTIIVFDTSGNSNNNTVWVTVQDTTAPTISHPSDFSYEYGSIGNNITWIATDSNPNSYSIFKDSVLVDSGSWGSGTPIVLDIDGLGLGTYNYTIVITDDASISTSDQVFVTVVDSTIPSLSNPSDVTYEFGTTGHNISWIITDAFPNTYNIYQDGIAIDSGSWSSGIPITINIDGLTLGVYNYTIVVTDSTSNSETDLVWVSVQDTTLPTITSPTDISYEHGSTGYNISWTSTDDFPGNYYIYRDGVQIDSGTWLSGIPIFIDVDGLAVGSYNYTIQILDSSLNNNTDEVWVTVIDQTNPTITSPNDVIYEFGEIDNQISWTVFDNNPGTYIIYNDGSNFDSGTWTSGVPISISVDGIGLGTHNFTILVFDSSSNNVTDLVWVTVNADITNPTISHPADFSYQFGTTGNTISWTAIDNNPDKYLIYRNNSIIDSGIWTNTTPITINVDGLGFGFYNFTILVNDTFHNKVSDLVWLEVMDDISPPIIINLGNYTYQVSTTGHSISWQLTDDNPNNYFIYRDGIEVDSGIWTNGVPVTTSIDGLSIGTYNYTILANDNFNNNETDTVWIFVVNDSTPPSTTSPSDLTYEFGLTGNTLSWKGTDLYPTVYRIYQNGVLNNTGTWTTGVPIIVNIDGLQVGNYNYTIIFEDVGSNSVSNEVWVTVEDTIPPNVTKPIDV